MSLGSLTSLLGADEDLADLLTAKESVVAVSEPARGFLVAGVAASAFAGPTLVVTPTGSEAERLGHDLAAFLSPESVELLPAWETLPFERVSPSTETMGRRLRAIWSLTHWPVRDAREGSRDEIDEERGPRPPHRSRSISDRGSPSAPRGRPLVVVSPIKALLQRIDCEVARREPLVVARGEILDEDLLLQHLSAAGYRREYQVEHRGEFSVRGGIVDVGPSTGEHGVRIDLFGDEVDRLTEFDFGDQRSIRDLSSIALFGAREFVPSLEARARAGKLAASAHFARERFEALAEGLVFDGMESWLPFLFEEEHLVTDLLPTSSRVVLVEPRRMRDRAAELIEEEAALGRALARTWGIGDDEELPRLHLDFDRLLGRSDVQLLSLPSHSSGPEMASFSATGWPRVHGDTGELAGRIGQLYRQGYVVVVCAENEGSARRLSDVLQGSGLELTSSVEGSEPAGSREATRSVRQPGISVVVQPLEHGFIASSVKLAVLAESDVTGRRRPHRVARTRARAVEGFFDALAPGDYVVHHVHGVARYAGMTTRSIAGSERDYLLLEYRGGDRLYVPSDQIDVITPYTGGETPSLSRLNGGEWQRQKSRVRAAVAEIAQELVVLYRRRLANPGHAFSPDTPWQAEMEQAFPYVETIDQLRALREVKADMEAERPMDRLVCGDVGFGKTEIAIRAAFKAVQDGYQVAVLVPTTLLAQQHFQTFSDRYSPYPIRVEMLSRFLTASESRIVVDGLCDGSVDVVIGTHRLLSSGVTWKRLGLVIVDEEQRFGVQHKEALKSLQSDVDALTLTASPIPRTLELSLTGLRDLSMLDTPPAERQPILTYVGEYDERAVAEALRRELLREGQVFYVHNRVADIEAVAADLGALVPEARIAVAHGQMDEGTLEQVVIDFSEGRYDVLVCTTIIESGIDMPTVNTLVVDRADLLGLGQLHQLRGRVGRAGQRAYAYLFHPVDRVLSEEAYERLKTIGELTELGSGLRIAMRDLEIRGAGNLLGRDQSGHIAAVGYDLYVRMVAEAVAELKGEPVQLPAEIKLDLPVEAFLPPTYVEREDLRLEAYRRLAVVREPAGVDDLETEWIDRYGPVPPPGRVLLAIARLRATCAVAGITEVTGVAGRVGGVALVSSRPEEVTVRISPLRLKVSGGVRLARLYRGAIYKEEHSQLVVDLPGGPGLPDAITELITGLVPGPWSSPGPR